MTRNLVSRVERLERRLVPDVPLQAVVVIAREAFGETIENQMPSDIHPRAPVVLLTIRRHPGDLAGLEMGR